jgi:hypothetical protein
MYVYIYTVYTIMHLITIVHVMYQDNIHGMMLTPTRDHYRILIDVCKIYYRVRVCMICNV